MMMRERKEIPKRTANCSVCKIINNLQCVKRRAWNIEALEWKNYTPEAFGFISFPFIERNGVGVGFTGVGLSIIKFHGRIYFLRFRWVYVWYFFVANEEDSR